MTRRTMMLAAPALVGLGATARAQAWPSQPIRIVHGYAAGSNPDTIARHMAPAMGELLGTTMIVDPKPGAAERLAATQVAKLPPDGYTLYMMTGGQAVVSATDPDLSYRLDKDFDFLSIVTRFPFNFVVPADSRFKTFKDYTDEARQRPGKLTYGSSGIGSTLHMAMELLRAQIGIDIVHVPYRGGLAQPLADMGTGQLDLLVSTLTNSTQLVRAGKLRSLAVTSKERSRFEPGIPAVSETVPGFDVVSWLGFTTPAGLPAPIRDRLVAAIQKVAGRPDIKGKLENLGNDVLADGPEAFRSRVLADLAKWKPLAHAVR
ncbi:MAG: tripartite tricarboxylate transporter substrate binding protein [Alphaproteobacteria bacterium]|nr:tripartite tricarboxylate transporter substrate binding protein [Alphaproteobacteria bacterium]MCW5741418.1 tripartite tricarboxylate transporter substrate binding protein [Alphaproteobacteria bacterium]